jgi:hypothetical protein
LCAWVSLCFCEYVGQFEGSSMASGGFGPGGVDAVAAALRPWRGVASV